MSFVYSSCRMRWLNNELMWFRISGAGGRRKIHERSQPFLYDYWFDLIDWHIFPPRQNLRMEVILVPGDGGSNAHLFACTRVEAYCYHHRRVRELLPFADSASVDDVPIDEVKPVIVEKWLRSLVDITPASRARNPEPHEFVVQPPHPARTVHEAQSDLLSSTRRHTPIGARSADRGQDSIDPRSHRSACSQGHGHRCGLQRIQAK